MKMRILFFVMVSTLFVPHSAWAKTEYLTSARLKYPTIVGTSLNSCSLCHSSGSNRNSYGADFGANNHSFTAIENMDSDDDTYSNIDEINAHTFPGNGNSHPTVTAAITVKKPNGGEVWVQGTKALVTWSSTGNVGTDVRIELWQNGAKVKNLKATTPNDGKQKVAVPSNAGTGNNYSIKIVSIADSGISDTSNAAFSIVLPTP